MQPDFYHGKRLSYDNHLCTVRFVGSVQGTKGEWLGVEWDDPERGKHDGSHNGVKYFDCLSPSPHPASFIRPSRPSDPPLSFLSALHKKYATPTPSSSTIPSTTTVSSPSSNHRSSNNTTTTTTSEISISGKTVQEIGFDKIERQLAELTELKIVVLDGMRVGGLLAQPFQQEDDDDDDGNEEMGFRTKWEEERRKVEGMGLKIQELDLGRGMVERWEDVREICGTLKGLRRLSVRNNRSRFSASRSSLSTQPSPFRQVTHLDLSSTFVTWSEMETILVQFPALKDLSIAENSLVGQSEPAQWIRRLKLETIDLASNEITSLSELQLIASSSVADSTLRSLSLRGNPLNTISAPDTSVSPPKGNKSSLLPQPMFPSLIHLSLAHTHLSTFSSFNTLPALCPSLISLLTTSTPLSHLPDSRLETIARIFTLKSLNHTPVNEKDRMNAEIWYLNRIGRSSEGLQRAREGGKEAFRRWVEEEGHVRFWELCDIYGEVEEVEEAIAKGTGREGGGQQDVQVKKPRTLGERLIRMTLFLREAASENELMLRIPPSMSITALKATVLPLLYLSASPPLSSPKSAPDPSTPAKISSLSESKTWFNPFSYRFVWETGELDPPPHQGSTMQDGGGWSDESEDESADDGADSDGSLTRGKMGKRGRKGRADWVQREIELADGAKTVGFWLDPGMEARVRVEKRE